MSTNLRIWEDTMTKHYSPTRRDTYRAAETKRRTLHSERTLARTTKTLTRQLIKD